MGERRRDCAIVDHLPDGSTVLRLWTVDEDTATRVAGMLGEPSAEQILDDDQTSRAALISAEAVMVVAGDVG